MSRPDRQSEEAMSLQVVHPHAAGIDIGNATHYVAIPPDRDPEPVRRFECFTEDLKKMAKWLCHCGIDTVAMQSTGVYFALSSALIGRVKVPPALG